LYQQKCQRNRETELFVLPAEDTHLHRNRVRTKSKNSANALERDLAELAPTSENGKLSDVTRLRILRSKITLAPALDEGWSLASEN
jgi:hypothetical protein